MTLAREFRKAAKSKITTQKDPILLTSRPE